MHQRKAGILLHITSLPGPYGVGDIDSGLTLIPFLQKSGISCWQFLPTCPVSKAFSYSPYMGYSAIAGNPLFISPELMVKDGFLDKGDLAHVQMASPYIADFKMAKTYRGDLVDKAFARLDGHFPKAFKSFCKKNSPWLDDYSLFQILKDKFEQQSWTAWPEQFRDRLPSALATFALAHKDELSRIKFEQFLFFSQWQQLRDLALAHDVALFGDMPIYVGHDSADVWGHQSCFELDPATCEPLRVAGVPPDYFSATGQRWGNPLYKWQVKGKKNAALYKWWEKRFKMIGSLVDMVRIDHFRGFEAYWAIDQKEETAINGKWVKGPGRSFFKDMRKAVTGLEIIAEDLGVITPEVETLRDDCGFAGMKILQFAFGDDAGNGYLPQNYQSVNSVVYGGTHDNDTAVGWFLDPEIPDSAKDSFRRLVNSDGSSVHHDFIRLAFSSVARLAVVTMQDVLGFGTDCRMNTPGTVENNWLWRCGSEYFNGEISTYLLGEVIFYNRFNETTAVFDNGADAE